MIDPNNVPSVEPDEKLARYVFQSSHIRRSDATVKADAFVPHPYQDLSVDRHRSATIEELWQSGARVAAKSGKTLHGRADFPTTVCLQNKLTVEANPNDGNPNHAIIIGWPTDKPLQKIIALELAASARFVAKN